MPSHLQNRNLTEAAVRPHIIRGSIWMVAMRWSIRAVGLVSTIALARLLAPADFGIVAKAMLFVGLIEVLGQTGLQWALIHHPNPTREHFDSAWTAQILVSFALGTLVFAAAPLAALFFGDPHTATLVQVLSLRVYLIGFENIGTVLFRRDFLFAREFRYNVYKKLLSFVPVLALAFYLRNYWALVIGIVLAQFLSVLLSYAVHPYRPRICLTKIRDIWNFSFWNWVITLGNFGYNKIDQYTVGAIASLSVMGFYQIGGELARMPSGELIRPLQRALFPAFARLGHDRKQALDAYLDVFSVVVVVAASTSTGVALVAEDLVVVLFGPHWRGAAPFVFWMSFAAAVSACCHNILLILSALGHVRRAAILAWSALIVMLPCLIVAAKLSHPEGIAVAYLAVAVALTPGFFTLLRTALPISAGQIIARIWRPLLAALAMATALQQIPADMLADDSALRLIVRIPLGAAAFVATLYLLWMASGQPRGVEQASLRYLGDHFLKITRTV